MVPEFVDRIGGSQRVQALPAGSKWHRAQPGGLIEFSSCGGGF